MSPPERKTVDSGTNGETKIKGTRTPNRSNLKSTSLVNDIQLLMMRSLIRKFITKKGLSLDQAQNLSMESFEGNKSLKELSERFFKVLNQINELKC